MPDELVLLQKCRNREERAMRTLVESHQPHVYKTISGMINNMDVAKDLTQEIFITFFNKIDKFQARSGLKTYLTRMAINKSLDELKKKKVVMMDIADLKNIESPAEEHITNDQHLIQLALSKLPVDFRAVIVTKLIDGYSVEETSEILKLPIGTVASRLVRGRQKLQTIINEIRNGKLVE